MSRVLVVGAGGFIGAHVVRAFLHHGWDVVAGLRGAAPGPRLQVDHRRLSFQAVDILALQGCDLAACRADLLVNCAGYGVNPVEDNTATAVAVNAVAIPDLVARAAASGIGRMVHLGSAVEYGTHQALIDEDAPSTAVGEFSGTYAATKLAGSVLALQAARAAGVMLCVARPFGCFGTSESPEKFVPGLLAALREHRAIDLTPGLQIRDYTFAGDVADAIVAAAEGQVAGVVNICSGVPITIRALGEALIRVVGADPSLARWGARPPRAGEVPRMVGDPTRMRRLTGWRPATSIEEGLVKTIAGQFR